MIYEINKSRHKKIQYEINDNGCWICTSHCKDKDGYAKIFVHQKHKRLHRYIYELNYGEIPDNMVIRHKCDNPSCINPEHLEVGTYYDNTMDRVNRGRTNPKSYNNLILGRKLKGENAGGSKLKEIDVIEIKKARGLISSPELAKRYNITSSAIRAIWLNKNWAWVKP